MQQLRSDVEMTGFLTLQGQPEMWHPTTCRIQQHVPALAGNEDKLVRLLAGKVLTTLSPSSSHPQCFNPNWMSPSLVREPFLQELIHANLLAGHVVCPKMGYHECGF